MNYFPSLKINFQHKFNNPLSGFIYDNKKYEDSIILKSQSKESFAPLNKSNKSKSITHAFYQARKSKERLRQKTQMQSQSNISLNDSKIFNATKRLSESKKMICSRTQSLSIKDQTGSTNNLGLSSVKRSITKAIFLDKQIPKQQTTDYTPYIFPQINALILSTFQSMNDFSKICKIDIKKYFEIFSKDNLLGTYFKQFIDLYQRHIDTILLKNNLQNEQSSKKRQKEQDYPPQYLNINHKKHLFQRLSELQRQNKNQLIQKLLEFYCLPLPSVRAIFLKDILDMISIQLYQNFNCQKNNAYVLINYQGKTIQDFAQIKFSTTQLFIAQKGKEAQSLQRYKQVLYNSKLHKNRYNFRQSLKSNFRKNVVKGNYEESPEQIIKSQSKISPIAKFAELNQKKANRSKIKLKFNQYLQKQSKEMLKDKSKPKINTNKVLNTSLQKDESRVSKSPYKNILQDNSYLTINEKIIQEFKLIQIKNVYKNVKLKEEEYRNKIQIGVLVSESIYFKTKNQIQIKRILQALEFITSQQQHYNNKLITRDQYITMRKIIDCIADRDYITGFVQRYLKYDDYGQVQKEDLSKTLSFIINIKEVQANAQATEVILKIIWYWLQKNGVIVNDSIKRGEMQMQYETNKLLYYFLISLVFGTNETTALDLAHQILL